MSLKCLKRVKISDTEADSVVPRNDEGRETNDRLI